MRDQRSRKHDEHTSDTAILNVSTRREARKEDIGRGTEGQRREIEDPILPMPRVVQVSHSITVDIWVERPQSGEGDCLVDDLPEVIFFGPMGSLTTDPAFLQLEKIIASGNITSSNAVTLTWL